MTLIYFYVLPMLLGRTYDIKTDSPGVDIFPQDVINSASVIQRHYTDSQYRMVSDTQEARDFLGVTGDLSLKIKTGNVQMEGLGDYLRETYSRSNVVEILVKVHYETQTYTLPSTSKPRNNWKLLDQRDVGTHYVRSVTYGGDLVASLRFTAKNAVDREKIRAVVQANLHADSGSFGLGIEGRTFHVGQNTVGVDIFSYDDIKNARVNPEPFYRSSYKTVETSSDVKEVLEINGDLSLNIKAGMFAIRGFGAYVKSAIRSRNSVDVLTKVSARTVSKSLRHDAKPIAGWRTLDKSHLGTHYVKSILYGGDLIACIRFKARNAEDLQDIRATIRTSLASGKALDLVGEGKLESLDQKLRKKATMEINYFATVPLEGVANNINGLRELVRGFEKHVQKVNGGIGVAVEVELAELSLFDRDFNYLKNTELETELEIFEEKLDDLLSSKNRLKNWVEDFPDSFTKDQEKEISAFSERISKILRIFIATIANLDLQKGSAQLEKANEAFKEGKAFGMPGKFRRDANRLLQKITPKSDYSDKYSSTYVHYGSNTCISDKGTTTIHSGYVASSSRNQLGGGFNYLCMPQSPVTRVSDDDPKVGNLSLIAGVKYGLLETKPKNLIDMKSVLRGVKCAVCMVERQALVTFHGETECPEKGGWKTQYSGHLMAATDLERSETVCVDLKLESNQENYMGVHDQSLNFAVVKHADGNFELIPCVVCSK